MCKIIHFQPGQMLPVDMLENAIANNWHGYGLIVKTPKKLTVLKKVPNDFDNPETTRGLFKEIHDLLKKYIKYERVIHLRHKTEGDVSEDNCHPFKVYELDGREVYFAHNGTMYEYRANTHVAGQEKDNRSDSKIFADKILAPLLELTKDGNYDQYMFKFLLAKVWGGTNNMGVLVSNDLPTYEFPYTEWKNIVVKNSDGEDVTIRASNDSYFKEIKRGPIYEENKKKKEEQERSFRPNHLPANTNTRHDWPLSQLRNIDFQQNNYLTEELVDIMDHIDLYTDEGLADLANLMHEEVDALVQDKPEVLGALFIHLSGKFAGLHEENKKLVEKHSVASKMVSELKKSAVLQ